MSYTPYTWTAGDVVTSARLNNIEQGIVGVESETTDLKSAITQGTVNLFDIHGTMSFWNFQNDDGVITNTNTDTNPIFRAMVKLADSSGTDKASSSQIEITSVGRYALSVKASSNGLEKIKIKHNGSTRDFSLTYDCTCENGYWYTVSFEVLACDPTTVGGVKFTNIQIEKWPKGTTYTNHKSAIDSYARRDINDMRPFLASLSAGTNLFSIFECRMNEAWDGGVNSPINFYTASNRCACGPVPLVPGGKYKLVVKSGYRTSYRTINANGTVLSDSGWITADTEFTAEEGKYYCFAGGKLNDASMNIADYYTNVSLIAVSVINPNYALKQDLVATLAIPGGTWATVDTTNMTLTLPADTSIIANSQTNARYNFPSAQVISLHPTSQTTSTKVYYDPSTSSFNKTTWGGKLPDGAILIAYFQASGGGSLEIGCPYKINGNPYGIQIPEKIEDEMITFNSNIKAVNHRGFNTVAPENTLPAFKLSRRNGFKYVETDVRFNASGTPVLLHDTTINRTCCVAATGASLVNESAIYLSSLTDSQMANYDACTSTQWATYKGTKIPTLVQFMQLCRNIGLTPRVELNELTVANAATMFNVINDCGMARKVEYNCNNIDVAQKFLELEPSAVIVYGMSSYDSDTVDAVGALKTNNNTIIINMYYSEISSELISKCQHYGIELEVWTVNSESTIKGLNPFISGVTSDSVNAATLMYNYSMN